jgi:mono/diheme cytochrome c family protein
MRSKRLKKRISLIYTGALLLLLSPVFALAMPWSWDMFDQPSYRAQEGLPPPSPEGTVPVKGKIGPLTTKEEAVFIRNPMRPTDESLARGKAVFGIYCALCHGEKGRGNGKLGKKYMSPSDLTSDYVQKLPDGEVYFIITYGGLAEDDEMPGQGDAIEPEDRWHLINYMKHVISWQ